MTQLIKGVAVCILASLALTACQRAGTSTGTGSYVSTASPSPSRPKPSPGYIESQKPGCKVYNPSPTDGVETVKWEGPCVSGYAHGFGRMTWTTDGKVTQAYDSATWNGLTVDTPQCGKGVGQACYRSIDKLYGKKRYVLNDRVNDFLASSSDARDFMYRLFLLKKSGFDLSIYGKLLLLMGEVCFAETSIEYYKKEVLRKGGIFKAELARHTYGMVREGEPIWDGGPIYTTLASIPVEDFYLAVDKGYGLGDATKWTGPGTGSRYIGEFNRPDPNARLTVVRAEDTAPLHEWAQFQTDKQIPCSKTAIPDKLPDSFAPNTQSLTTDSSASWKMLGAAVVGGIAVKEVVKKMCENGACSSVSSLAASPDGQGPVAPTSSSSSVCGYGITKSPEKKCKACLGADYSGKIVCTGGRRAGQEFELLSSDGVNWHHSIGFQENFGKAAEKACGC